MADQNIFENIEHAKHISDMLQISNISESKIKLDLTKFVNATLFFLDDVLQDIKKENIPTIHFMFDLIKQNSRGTFCMEKDFANIYLSTKNIVKQFKEGFIQDTLLDSFFYVLLHEIAHLVQFLKLCSNKKGSMEVYFNKDLEKRNKDIDQINNHYKFDHRDLALMNHKNEIEADRFAYKNLQYYKTLYEMNGYAYCSIYMCRKEEKSID